MSASEAASTATAVVEDVCGQLPGLSTDYCARVLDDVARELLARTQVWKLDFRLNSRAGLTDYRLDPKVAGARVCSVLAVRLGDRTLAAHQPRLGESEPAGQPRSWWLPVPGTIRLFPAPDSSVVNGISLRGVLAPIDSIAPVPEDILQPLREAMMLGTMAKLFAMPGKPWTSVPLALRTQRQYSVQSNAIRRDHAAYTTPEGREWSFPRGMSHRG